MKILAVDSSAKVSSVAVVDENGMLASFTVNTALTHSQTLMLMLEAGLKAAAIPLSSIDYFACSAGPGSFTGLRIGIGAIKGLAYGSNKLCVGVSTLEALAQNMLGASGFICAVMDARCGQVYHALFEGDGNYLGRLCEDSAITLDELEQKLLELSAKQNAIPQRKFFLVGDGADLCYNKLSESLPAVVLANDLQKRQSAVSVGTIAIKMISEGKAVSPAALAPAYIRLPQAQRELLKKQQNEVIL